MGEHGGFFPPGARRIGEKWFKFVSGLAFLRFNYRHFNHSSLPTWTENDTLLAERADSLPVIARCLLEPGTCTASRMLVAAFDEIVQEDSKGMQSAMQQFESMLKGAPRALASRCGGVCRALDAPGKTAAELEDVWATLVQGAGVAARRMEDPSSALVEVAAALPKLRVSFDVVVAAAASSPAAPMSSPRIPPRSRTLRREAECFIRMVKPSECDMLADFQMKWIFVGYAGRSTNMLKSCEAGVLVIFGKQRKDLVSGVAVVADRAVTCVQDLDSAPADLRDFVRPFNCFDYCGLSKVFDMRPLEWSWSEFASRTRAVLPRVRQGFPTLSGEAGLRGRVLEVCNRMQVVERV